jgi:hypothetical protein
MSGSLPPGVNVNLSKLEFSFFARFDLALSRKREQQGTHLIIAQHHSSQDYNLRATKMPLLLFFSCVCGQPM